MPRQDTAGAAVDDDTMDEDDRGLNADKTAGAAAGAAGAAGRSDLPSTPGSATNTSSALSPLTLLSLSDQTFTPLSVASSDFYLGSALDQDDAPQHRDHDDHDDHDDGPGHHRLRLASPGYHFRSRQSALSSTSHNSPGNTGAASGRRPITSGRAGDSDSLTTTTTTTKAPPGKMMGIGVAGIGGRGRAERPGGAEDDAPATTDGPARMALSIRATNATRKQGFGLLSHSPLPHPSQNLLAGDADADGLTNPTSSPSASPTAAADSASPPPSQPLLQPDSTPDPWGTTSSTHQRNHHTPSAWPPAPYQSTLAETQFDANNAAQTPSSQSPKAAAATPQRPLSFSGSTAANTSPRRIALSTTEVVTPQFTRKPVPLRAGPQSPPTTRSTTNDGAVIGTPTTEASPKVVRSRSVLRHPVPDINTRSGAYTTNIAALEASAERLSETSNIEDAIRDAHEELKRTDSRRSSVLAASIKNPSVDGDAVSAAADAQLPAALARSSSIVGVNNSARLGGYSPARFIMSPTHSITSGRARSGSKGSAPPSRRSSVRSSRRSVDGEGDAPAFMSRHGPGKGSVHSVYSVGGSAVAPLSLTEIAEIEPPTTLTHEAMDAAERTAAAGGDTEDEDTIRASAFQHVEPGATDIEVDIDVTPIAADSWAQQPMLDHAPDPYWDDHRSPKLQLRNPTEPAPYEPEVYNPPAEQRPGTAGSGDTYQQTKDAFQDFDGVHCDPDTVAELFPFRPAESAHPPPTTQRQSRAPQHPTARPTSYFDPGTGQQMLYYPARVPAMLNLPPKLGKGVKAAAEKRRSQVLNAMPQTSRESRMWLPDPLEGHRGSAFLDDAPPGSSHHHTGSEAGGAPPAAEPFENVDLGQAEPIETPAGMQVPGEPGHLRRPTKLGGVDKHKPRASMMPELPPQLRASAFFELPSETPRIEVKDGSAMATLDSILDAAAKAPVNAFTDHAIAGHLGAEIYGIEKHTKRKSRHSRMLSSDKLAASGPAPPEAEKRKTVWSMLHGRRKSEQMAAEAGQTASLMAGDERHVMNGEPSPLSALSAQEAAALAPGEDEEGSASDEEAEGHEVYQGPPTTLLAELQLRKQQQKMRTRPINKAFPNGLHSTLLELDTVAQVEAQHRRGKKINLAWEDPSMNPEEDESDDEDVPLGMLALKKQLGDANNVAAVAAEVNRPLGLMERRELEENEPLSRRRDRLQGKEVPANPVYLNPGGGATRASMLTLNPPGLLNGRSQSSPHLLAPQQQQGPQDSDDDGEGETLAERMRRLKAQDEAENPLPRARPVSNTFSSELLSAFGGDDDAAKDRTSKDSKGKPGAGTPHAPEEEETLGQRRRRLQAEREAREREMASSSGSRTAALAALNGTPEQQQQQQRLSRRLSLADVLAANPVGSAAGPVDPREAERRRREDEAARATREKEDKMRAYRQQMPTALPVSGAGLARTGGYLGGRFNDGTGGGAGLRAVSSMGALPRQQQQQQQRVPSGYGAGYGAARMHQQQPLYPAVAGYQAQPGLLGMGGGGYQNGAAAAYGGVVAGGGYGAYASGMPVQMQMPMPTHPPQPPQLDMVERWRQSIMP